MEIAVLPQHGLRIKGKQGSLTIDATKQAAGSSALLLLSNEVPTETHTPEGSIVMQGPGSYEVSGIKVTGMRHEGHLAYGIVVDRVNVLVGKASDLEKMHTKLQEYHIVAVNVDAAVDLAFVSNFAPRAILFYGEKAEEAVKMLAKENIKKESKYSTTFEKLPQETEEILLS